MLYIWIIIEFEWGNKYIVFFMVSEELDKINVLVFNIIFNFSNLIVKFLLGVRR